MQNPAMSTESNGSSSANDSHRNTYRASKEEVEECVVTHLFVATVEALLDAEFNTASKVDPNERATVERQFVETKLSSELGTVTIRVPRNHYGVFRAKILKRQKYFYGEGIKRIISLAFQQRSARYSIVAALYEQTLDPKFIENVEASLKNRFCLLVTAPVASTYPVMYFGRANIGWLQDDTTPVVYSSRGFRLFSRKRPSLSFNVNDKPEHAITLGYCLASPDAVNSKLLGIWREEDGVRIPWSDVCLRIKSRGLLTAHNIFVDESPGLMSVVVKMFPFSHGVAFNCYRSNDYRQETIPCTPPPKGTSISEPDRTAEPVEEIKEHILAVESPVEMEPPDTETHNMEDEDVRAVPSDFPEIPPAVVQATRPFISLTYSFLLLLGLGAAVYYGAFGDWGWIVNQQTVISTTASLPIAAAPDLDPTNEEVGLVLALHKKNRERLMAAIREAGARPDLEFSALLAALADNPDAIVRVAVVKALSTESHRNTPFAVEALTVLLEDEDFLVRAFAAKMLAARGDEEARLALQERLPRETNEIVRKFLVISAG